MTNNTKNINQIPIDLHCHSTYSDGSHSVQFVLDTALANGSKYLALTDHDTVDGILEAKHYAQQIGINLISGVEISVTWANNNLIHIVGLNINEEDQNLKDNLHALRMERYHRGEKISQKLARIGIPNAIEGAMQYCDNKLALSRTHFSRFLTDNGYAKEGKAFDKYLAPGKVAYVAQKWASLKDAVSWIINSGGIAVIAHPCRYKFTRTKLLNLISEFKEYGGRAIEVISSSHTLDDAFYIANLAKYTNLYGSVGSDFHRLNEGYRHIRVGINHPIPNNICEPIFPFLNIDKSLYNDK